MEVKESTNYKDKIEYFFSNLSVEQIDLVNDFYHQDAHFKDPLIDIKGVTKIKDYYHHVYQPVTSIKFIFTNYIEENNKIAACWTMKLAAPKLNKGQEYQVEGMSRIIFDEESGKVIEHQDYYDLSEFLYDRLPLISCLTKFIKNKLHPGE